MKKLSVIFLIFSLILFTTLIKNSTKKIEEEIFIKKENLRVLKKKFGTIKLENDYLGSSERLYRYRDLYFEGVLVKKNLDEMKIISEKKNQFKIKELKLTEK